MNEYDSNRILDILKPMGYISTSTPSEADCYVLNTCHIREKATDKVYHDIGRLKKEFRNKKKPMLLVTGCVAQAENQEMLNREKYIDGVVGPQSYHQLPNIIKKIENEKLRTNSTDFEVVEKFDSLNLVKNSNSKISSFLTIQEGCDKFCHFCVVPYTRGPEYSRSYDKIKTYRLSDLIFKLNDLKKLKRIRYTTSHPKDVTEDLIRAHRDCKKLMPILHLPVQSGSSKILKAMNRKHDAEEYSEIINNLKKVKPNIKFSSDFIIGYPGETDADFQQTLELIKKTEFINSYSFVYSPRPGTPASELTDVKQEVSKKRLIKLQNILEELNTQSKKKFLNKSTEVLFENKMKNQSKYFGRDKFLNSIVVESKEDLTGQLLNVKIINYNHNSLFGEIYDKENINNAA